MASEHQDKSDGDFNDEISAENKEEKKSGSDNCEDEAMATVLQVQVSSLRTSKIEKHSEDGDWFAIDTGASVTLSG